MTTLEIVEFVAASAVQVTSFVVAMRAARRRMTLGAISRGRYAWPWVVFAVAVAIMIARASTSLLVRLDLVEIDWYSIEGASRFVHAVLVLVAIRAISGEGENDR